MSTGFPSFSFILFLYQHLVPFFFHKHDSAFFSLKRKENTSPFILIFLLFTFRLIKCFQCLFPHFPVILYHTIFLFTSYYFLVILWDKRPETPSLVKSSIFLLVLTLLDLSVIFCPIDYSPWRLLQGFCDRQHSSLRLIFSPSHNPSSQLVLFFPLYDLISAHSFSFLSRYLIVFINGSSSYMLLH